MKVAVAPRRSSLLAATHALLLSALMMGCGPSEDPAKPKGSSDAQTARQTGASPANAGAQAAEGATDAGAPIRVEGTAPSVPEIAVPAERTPATGASCLSDCEMAIMSEDDRATCRLRCKAASGEADAEPEPKSIGSYLGCSDACEQKSADDRATCYLNCAGNVAGTDTCERTCLEQLGRCVDPCFSAGKTSSACVNKCRAPASTCVSACAQ